MSILISFCVTGSVESELGLVIGREEVTMSVALTLFGVQAVSHDSAGGLVCLEITKLIAMWLSI